MIAMVLSEPSSRPSEIMAIAREVAGIVRRVTGDPAYRVFLFGSWATGRARERADVDIAIAGPSPVPPAMMFEIREASEALPTLFTVDLVDLAAAAPSFREGLALRPVETGDA